MTSIVKGKLVCVALNDQLHRTAMQEAFNKKPHLAPPTEPVLYFKPRNTWSETGARIPWPEGEKQCVVGASLGVVIGKRACRVSVDQVDDHIAGYTLVHDFSLPETSYFRPDIKGKCQDGSAPVGSTVSPCKDLKALVVKTYVNDKLCTALPVTSLHLGVAELVSRISYIMTLKEGDVIAVGFPAERVAVNPNDIISTRIDGIDLPALENTVGAKP